MLIVVALLFDTGLRLLVAQLGIGADLLTLHEELNLSNT